jgi:hypothetical protein
MILSAWQAQNAQVDKLIEKLTDEQWMSDTAPGRNSGIYLLGHLTAVNDGMISILGFGPKLHPELEPVFLFNKDKSGQALPSLTNLKKCWKEINATLNAHIELMSTEDWFAKHTKVSDEDFAKEPHRNKLNIIISRTHHQSYHLGQLTYL